MEDAEGRLEGGAVVEHVRDDRCAHASVDGIVQRIGARGADERRTGGSDDRRHQDQERGDNESEGRHGRVLPTAAR